MKLKKVMMVSYLEFASAPPLPTTQVVIRDSLSEVDFIKQIKLNKIFKKILDLENFSPKKLISQITPL